MNFFELLLIGIIVGLISFGGAFLIILLLELSTGFIRFLFLQKKLKKLEEQQKKTDIDFEKLQNDLDHWTNLLKGDEWNN